MAETSSEKEVAMAYNPKDFNHRVSPVHYSKENGVHADYNPGNLKQHTHVPFVGQTTLDTFTKPSYKNDAQLTKLGGTLKGD